MRRLLIKHNDGVILIVVLWILTILSFLAIGLSHQVRMDLALTKYSIGKVRSKYAAMSGLAYAMEQIREDNQNEKSSSVDTKYQCGFFLKEGQEPEAVFKNKEIGDGYFSVGYYDPDAQAVRFGLQDEESKINLNSLNSGNYEILKYLLDQLGFADAAETVASAVIDWIDADNEVFNRPWGAEEEEYQHRDVPYHCKNKPFDSLEELMLVKGMTPEIFSKVKEYLTVFPRQDNLAVNFDTASPVVLKALARSVTGSKTQTSLPDADALVERMLSYRQGPDGQWGTADDRTIDGNDLGLGAHESAIFQAISYSRTKISRYLRVGVQGVDESSGITTHIEAVILRNDVSLVYWHRDS